VIDAIYGLGEAIVSGAVTDHFVVSSADLETQRKSRPSDGNSFARAPTSRQRTTWSMSPKAAAIRSKRAAGRIRPRSASAWKHIMAGRRVEWAYEGGKFYIVRPPVTTTISTMAEEDDGARNRRS
jgi:phosphoenolpyruvate synthase/pyruvate phosphate dikinase